MRAGPHLSNTGVEEESNCKILDQCLVKNQFLFPIVRDLYFYKYAKNEIPKNKILKDIKYSPNKSLYLDLNKITVKLP